MLSKQLNELETDGIVNRKMHQVVPPKVEYSLTEFGLSVIPILKSFYEIGQFAKWANILGAHYLGVCCGANPMLIREVAESVGLKVPASKYRENMENHFMYGKNKRIPKHMTDYGDKA